MFEEVLERIKYYKKLGVNPLSLATGCAVKVDLLRVVYPALGELVPKLREKGLVIAPREDADIFPRPKDGVEIHRRIYSLGKNTNVDPKEIRSIKPSRAIVLVQVYQRYADEPEKFAELVGPVYEKIAESHVPIHIGKGHSIVTPFKEDQFVMVDFIKPLSSAVEGFTLANNDTIHIIDPTDDPGSYKQVSGALSNTLNDLFVLGAYENLRLALVVNAPLEELVDKMIKHAEKFAKEVEAEIVDVPLPKKGKLLIGATALADTLKHPPVFYDKVKPGMKLIATRPFGELAPINVYIACIIDESIIGDLEQQGLTIEALEKYKDEAVETISRPNKKVAKVINKYLPEYNEVYREDEHIAATTDVTGPGIYVVRELAEQTKTKILLHDIPLLFPEISRIASSLYLIPNATAGTNGAFVVIAPNEIVDDILSDLKAIGLNPVVFGEVIDKGEPEVIAPKKLKEYVVDRKILSKFKIVEEVN